MHNLIKIMFTFTDQTDVGTCVAMSDPDHGTWFDEDCEMTYGAVCERMRDGETRPPTVPTNPDGNCASGWNDFGNHCYQVRMCSMLNCKNMGFGIDK